MYLNKLYDELISMDNFFEVRQERSSNNINITQKALKYVESCGERDENRNDLVNTLITHQHLSMYYEKNSTYSEMISTGTLAEL